MQMSASAAKGWKFADGVEITADDIAWFRGARSTWINSESGAPAIVPVDAPSRDFFDALDVAGGYLQSRQPASAQDFEDALAILSRLEKIVCAFFLHAHFVAGDYALRHSPDGRTHFVVMDQHLLLLRCTRWRAAAIDSKRPYGDYTNYPIDMARTLGLPITEDAQGYDELDAETDKRMEALHHEMLFVVQAYIEHAELSPGRWFVPYAGWHDIIRPRCAPPTAAQVAAYRQSMSELAARSLADPRMSEIHFSDFQVVDALFTVQ